MLCIFCLTDQYPGNEHVFPLAVGGTVRTDRVCCSCNSTLGAEVDAPLTDHLLIALRRWQLNLDGNSGKSPDGIKLLFSDGVLASDPSRKMFLIENQKTGRKELRLGYKRTETTLPDGSIQAKISIDARGGAQEVRKILDRERKRGGLERLNDADADEQVADFLSKREAIEHPCVIFNINNFEGTDFQIGLFKIAYELAFLWLGEKYLYDPTASTLRDIILGKTKPEEANIRAAVDCGVLEDFRFWSEDNNCHIAYSTIVNGGVAVSVRVFDIFSACVIVAEEAGQYVSGHLDEAAIRFLHINPTTKEERQCSLAEERRRLRMRRRTASP